MSAREIIVVDCETTGLEVSRHTTVEVAWWHLGTGQRGRFVPPHRVSEVLSNANLQALRVNRYIDRLADTEQDHDGKAARELADVLHGNTLAGATPSFDERFLRAMYASYEDRELCGAPRWHHRLLDLSAYAAGVLGLPPTELPGLSAVCELLSVTNPAPHTAEGDTTATGNCFLRLFDRAANRLPT